MYLTLFDLVKFRNILSFECFNFPSISILLSNRLIEDKLVWLCKEA